MWLLKSAECTLYISTKDTAMSEREKNKKRKRSLLFWFVFLLTVSVIATSILTVMLMDKYYFDASGAIDISSNNPNAQQVQPETENQANSDTQLNTDSDAENSTSGQTSTSTSQSTSELLPANPSFEASDAGGVWATVTKVDIFKSSYTNKHGQMTVKSDDGDKVIAPGTSNSFVFKLSNTGDVPLDFELDIDAYITPDGYRLPVKARLSRYDNKWLVGDKDTWVSTPVLDTAYDGGTMAAGKYFYYTLDWEWPFEEDDVYDTATGNLAVTDDISLTIVIKTRAEGNSTITGSGISLPNTGDTSNIVIWGTVFAVSFVSMIIIVFFLLIERREKDDEENTALGDA